MKLVHPDWNHCFDFSEYNTYSVVIENPAVYRKYLSEIYSQATGDVGCFVLSESNKELKISEKIDVLIDLLFFTVNNKKITTAIQNKLKDFMVAEDMYMETTEILSSIEQYAETICDTFSHDITYKPVDHLGLLKMLGFEPRVEYDGPCEKLIEYFNLAHEVCKTSCFVLVQPSSVLSAQEMKMLVDNCERLKHNIILLESTECPWLLDYSKRILIDFDGCEIF